MKVICEVICDKCNGTGVIDNPNIISKLIEDQMYYKCVKCNMIANFKFTKCNCGTTKRKYTIRTSKDKEIPHRSK